MKREYTEKVMYLEGTGRQLMLASAEQLLCGKELDRQSWQNIVGVYKEILSMAQQEPSKSISTLSHAIGQLAYVILSSTLSLASHLSEQMAPDPELGLPRLLAQVIVARQRAELDQQQPVYHLEFAEKLYLLGSHVKNRECITQGGQTIAGIYLYALELFAQQNNLANANDAATQFVGMANELASKVNIPRFMPQALYWGERVIEANTPPRAEVWTVIGLAINLVNTYNWFAATYPSKRQEYLERGIIVAEYGWNAVQISAKDLKREQYLMVLEHSSSALMRLHLSLAIMIPDRFYVHANKIWKTLREYLDLVEQHKHHDLQSESFALRVAYSVKLKELQPDWVPPIIRFQQEDIILPEWLSILHFGMYAEPRRKQAAKIANQIILFSDSIQQQKAIEEIIDLWYSELAYLLPKIISEVGLNYYVCRLILILALLASGRIDPIISQPIFGREESSIIDRQIFYWQWDSTQDYSSPYHSKEILDHQELSPKQYDIEEKNVIGTIIGLSEFAEILRRSSALVDILHRTLREQNAVLLKSILSHKDKPQYLDNVVLTAIKDLHTLGRNFSKEAKLSMLDSYNKF